MLKDAVWFVRQRRRSTGHSALRQPRRSISEGPECRWRLGRLRKGPGSAGFDIAALRRREEGNATRGWRGGILPRRRTVTSTGGTNGSQVRMSTCVGHTRVAGFRRRGPSVAAAPQEPLTPNAARLRRGFGRRGIRRPGANRVRAGWRPRADQAPGRPREPAGLAAGEPRLSQRRARDRLDDLVVWRNAGRDARA